MGKLKNGSRAQSVSYQVGSSPATSCYDLKRYDGSKHCSTKDEFYKKFRCNDYGSRRCPVCYPDQEDSDSETESESETETESIESIIQITKESKDGSILGPDFMSVPESTSKSESKSVQESEPKSVPESESKSDSESKSTNPESGGKLVKLNSVSGQLQAICHKIRAIFKYLDTNGILRHETISRRKRKFGKSKSLPTMARQLSTLSDVFTTTLNY